MAAFATVSDLFVRLGASTPAATSIEYKQAKQFLDDASGAMRFVTGQMLDAGTSTITERVPVGGVVSLPAVPIRAVHSVTAVETGEPLAYTIENSKQIKVCADGNTRIAVNYDHGWTVIPDEIKRWTRVLAASYLAAAGSGNLGLAGGLSSVAVDDGRAVWATNNGEQGQGVEIPEGTRIHLRSVYGSLSMAVEHRL